MSKFKLFFQRAIFILQLLDARTQLGVFFEELLLGAFSDTGNREIGEHQE